MKKSRACFADGGQISKADQLIAEMNAKYGVSGNAPAPTPVVQQPAPQPAPKPQSKGLIGDALNLFGNRQKQIDKASGYANGGKIGEPFEAYSKRQYAEGFRQNIEGVRTNYETFGRGDSSAKMQRRLDNYSDAAHESVAKANREADNSTYRETRGAARYANGGLIEGIGTPTSDSIPAKVRETGEEIAVSTKERIVSHEQDKLLQRLAKAMGFDSVDAFFEAGTGKPVGPTIKGGKMAHSEGGKPAGWRLDNDPDAYAKAMQDTRNAMSIPSLSTNNSAANGGIYKDVGLPSISMGAGQAPTIYDNGGLPTKTDRVSGSLPVATVSKPVGDGARPWYMQDPLTAISSGIEKSMNASQAAEDYNKSLYPAGTFDSATKPAAQQPVSAAPVSSATQSPVALSAGLSGIIKPGSDANFMTGAKPGEMPSSAQGGFTQGGKSYNVNQVSQDGDKAINRVTAPGTSPLYTNIKPEDAVSGLKNQMIGGDAASVNEGLARYARSVAINKERIDAQPMGGISVLPDQAAEANAQLDAMRQSSLVSGLSPSQQAAFQQAQAQLAMQGRGQQLTADNARYAADVQAQRAAGHDQVIARGQDLNAQNEERRIAGNPLDNQTKQLSLTQAQRISELQGKAIAGDKTALASLQALTGKNPNADRYITVQGGEEIGPDGMSKIRRPSYVFDQQTGRRVQEDGQQSGAPSVGEVRGGYRFKGGNPADKAAWEKA